MMRITEVEGKSNARLDGSGWNTIFESLIKTFKKLQALGHTYYNGKVAIIQSGSEEKADV